MLRFQLLGGLLITLDEKPVTGFISSKTQALLCYLALNRRQPHLRASLAALFWGDMPDEDAATNLRQSIANLKKLLEPYFEITRQSIQFNTDRPYWLDVQAFEESHDPQLYRGELLAGFGLPDTPDFDDWITTERERLHELALTTLRKAAATALMDGQDEAGIHSLKRLLALDPLQEKAHRALMLALALNGQRSAALSQYEICRTILKRELAVEPEAETTSLYHQIKMPRMVHLPAETTPFIGREEELQELTRRLADPTCHLITLVGLGGIGKTRLALRLARQHANRFLHGAVLVELTSVTTLPALLSALADGLPLPLSRESNPHRQVLDYLREKHLLLVLDNFEQLISAGSELINELLHTAPELKILVTSRQRLNLRAEWTLALDGLPFQDTSSQVDKPPPALALFWETARRVRGDDLIRSQSVTAVQHICQIVEGMPLAIELAAAWSRLMTCEELAQEIESNLTALQAVTRDDEERHRSLRAVFDHSWQLFSAQEQRVLMALSAFVGGFTREAAAQMAGASQPMLLGLADKMLLRRDADGRFSLHEMTRQYLSEKLAESDTMPAVRAAFIEFFTHFLSQRESRLKSAEQRQVLDEIGGEIENIHTAWQTAITGRNIQALSDMMPALSMFHDVKANWFVGEEIFQSAGHVLDSADVAVLGNWLSHMALFSGRLEKADDSRRFAEKCCTLLSDRNPTHLDGLARALTALGRLEDIRGQFRESLPFYQKALELRNRLGDELGQADSLLNLTSATAQLKEYPESESFAKRGLAITRRLGDLWLTSKFQTVQALIADATGDLDRAETLHKANLEIAETLGSLEARALAINGLGSVNLRRENHVEAKELFLSVLDMNRQLGVRTWEAGTLNNLGVVAYETGDLQGSRDYLQQAQAVFHALGNEQAVQIIQDNLDELEQEIRQNHTTQTKASKLPE
jgi:DNA-binding SARP family transcriptional activator